MRDLTEHLDHALAQVVGLAKLRLEAIDSCFGAHHQFAHFFFALCAVSVRDVDIATFFHLSKTMAKRFDQLRASARVVDHVVLQVWIALYNPDITQHLKQHPGTAAGFPLSAKRQQNVPCVVAQESNDNFTIREARVVVRNFANTTTGFIPLGGRAYPSGLLRNRFGRFAGSRGCCWHGAEPKEGLESSREESLHGLGHRSRSTAAKVNGVALYRGAAMVETRMKPRSAAGLCSIQVLSSHPRLLKAPFNEISLPSHHHRRRLAL